MDEIDKAFEAWRGNAQQVHRDFYSLIGERASTDAYNRDDAAQVGFRAGYLAALARAAKEVPTNWCDPLLTGDARLVDKSPCPEIEALLLAIKKRIEALSPTPSRDGSERA